MSTKFATVDDYIGSLPMDVQVVLNQVRQTIRAVAPDTGETISYQMPTITLNGKSLVHIAAWKHHIALYPVPATDDGLEREIAPFRSGKSTLRFPLGKPMPYELIGRLVALSVQRRLDSRA